MEEDTNSYEEYDEELQKTLKTLVEDYYNNCKRQLLMHKTDANPTKFNALMHNDAVLVNESLKDCVKCEFPSLVHKFISTKQQDFQKWYLGDLSTFVSGFQNEPSAADHLFDFYEELVTKPFIARSYRYVEFITKSFYLFCDRIHTAMMKDKDDLVASIEFFSKLVDVRITHLGDRFPKMDPKELHSMHIVAQELLKLLKEKLISQVIQKVHPHIYNGILSPAFDWYSNTIPLQADQWPALVMSQYVQCMQGWGTTFCQLRPTLNKQILNSILFSIQQIPSLSPNGAIRLLLDIDLVNEAFGERYCDSELAIIKNCINTTIKDICSVIPRSLRQRKDEELKKNRERFSVYITSLNSE